MVFHHGCEVQWMCWGVRLRDSIDQVNLSIVLSNS